MIGRSTAQDRAQIAPPASSSAAQNRSYSRAAGKTLQGASAFYPYGLVILLALYFVWALLEQHEKIRTAIKPQAIGVNLRNIAVIMITVILGLNLAKIVVGKLCAWGLPGAKFLQMLVGGA